jgi:ribosomal protein S21|tara:strand:- start:163 stop:393 length:231 start_codon:yes stop_codon:yes gene_type:complete
MSRRNSRPPLEYGLVVRGRNNESPEKLITRFKRMMKKTGAQSEIRERYIERFVSPSEKKRAKKKRAIRRISKNSGR